MTGNSRGLKPAALEADFMPQGAEPLLIWFSKEDWSSGSWDSFCGCARLMKMCGKADGLLLRRAAFAAGKEARQVCRRAFAACDCIPRASKGACGWVDAGLSESGISTGASWARPA
jgi:hypothetical protein